MCIFYFVTKRDEVIIEDLSVNVKYIVFVKLSFNQGQWTVYIISYAGCLLEIFINLMDKSVFQFCRNFGNSHSEL